MKTISRRTTLKAAVVTAASLAASRAFASPPSYTPALIIGSGFGGAVSALRLGEAGIPTLVLERGKRWPIRSDGDTFATFEQPDGRAAWLSNVSPVHLLERDLGLPPAPIDVYTGVWQHIAGQGIDVIVGSAVGGGSIAYNAITVQPKQEDFERVFRGLVRYDEMAARYYPRARSVIKPEVIPDDLLASELYRSMRVQKENADRAGLAQRPLELAIDWDIVRQEIRGERRPSAIAGQSWYGLNSGAKRSLDRTYLQQAEQTGCVDVLPLHEVTHIGELPRLGLYTVHAREIDERGRTLGEHRFLCRYLFLAAGSIGTSKLLLKARETRALPRLPKAIGKYWGGNGDAVIVRAGGTPTNPGTGGISGQFIAEDRSDPEHPVSLHEATTPSHLALNPGVASFLAMVAQPAVGELRYDRRSGDSTLFWPDASDPRLAPGERAIDGIVDKLNAAGPTVTVLRNSKLTVHPLGGAVMGEACDRYGRVKGHRGLYVMDGALIPGSTGIVNPSLTIAALAERNIEHFLSHEL